MDEIQKMKALNGFSHVINTCAEIVMKHRYKQTGFCYALSGLYAHAMRASQEVIILLRDGYPQGAMSLARSIWEACILTEYLIKHSKDEEMIQRFIDDYAVKAAQDRIAQLEWYILKTKSLEEQADDAVESLKISQDEKEQWIAKYSAYVSGKNESLYFSQYWWAGGKKSFKEIAKDVGMSTNNWYDAACRCIHPTVDCLHYQDKSESGFLLGSCHHGFEEPYRFALLNFGLITESYFISIDIDKGSINLDDLRREIILLDKIANV